jgi:hypothetical protein
MSTSSAAVRSGSKSRSVRGPAGVMKNRTYTAAITAQVAPMSERRLASGMLKNSVSDR